MTRLEPVEIASPAFKRDPHPFYARLRHATPLCRVMLPSKQLAWLVARYDDVNALLRDERFAKDRHNALTPEQLRTQRRIPKLFEPLMRNMLDRDDPDHARLRRLVQKTFTAHRVSLLESRTHALAHELLDAMEHRRDFDLVEQFAMPLPVTVISDLLGVPVGDRAKFARWSKTMIKNTMTPLSVLLSLPHMIAFVRYLRALIADKRAAPADDLVSALVEAEEDGEHLDADELLGMIAILLTAGHETTANLIANGMLALLEHPKQLQRLRDEPACIDTAVEELLRHASPVETSTLRYARCDLELCGTRIARGDVVLGIIASANRDERQFHEPDALDLGRHPNKHLTFGQGGHYCVGAPLARMEGRIAFSALLQRLPHLRLAKPADALRWRRGMVLRGLEALPLTQSR